MQNVTFDSFSLTHVKYGFFIDQLYCHPSAIEAPITYNNISLFLSLSIYIYMHIHIMYHNFIDQLYCHPSAIEAN